MKKKALIFLLFSLFLAGCSTPEQTPTIPTGDLHISGGVFYYTSPESNLSFNIAFPDHYQGKGTVSASGSKISVFGDTITIYPILEHKELQTSISEVSKDSYPQLFVGDTEHTVFFGIHTGTQQYYDKDGNPWYTSIRFVD